MDHHIPPSPIGRVVADGLAAAGISMREAERATGLARTTLTRKISSGDFKVAELEALAALLGLRASALIGMAEDAA